MIDKDMCGGKYELFLISGKSFKGTLKQVFHDCIVLEVNKQSIVNGNVTSEVHETYHIAMDKIEYIKVSEKKIK